MTEKSSRRTAKTRAVDNATSRPKPAGQVNITGTFDVSVRSALRQIQVQYPKAQVRDLLAEALNLLFAKYGVPQAAPKPDYNKP